MAAIKEIKPDARILIVDLAFIGDILMSTPAYVNVRRAFPDAFIDILVAPGSRPVIENSNLFNRIWTTGMKTGGWRSVRQESGLTRAECYDVAVCFHRGHGSLLMLWLAGVPERVGFTNQGRWVFLTRGIPFRLECHRTWNHLKLLEKCLPMKVDYTVPTFMNLDGESETRIDALIKVYSKGKELIAINPNAAWPTKRWTLEGFARVADGVAEMGYLPVLVGGPSEKEISGEVIRNSKAEVWDLTGETTLQDLAVLLSRSKVVVSNDSGPMHMANAVGTPVVPIFGPTDPGRCGPWLGKVEPIQAKIDCSKCYKKQCTHMTCMRKIEPSDVLDSIQACIR